MRSKIFFSITNNLKCFKFLKIKQALLDASQLVAYSLVFSHVTFIPYVHAGPAGGNIVGGSGSIQQSGLTTTINQNTSSLAIDWNSYNINSNEVVNYLQPDSSSIALNRILGGSASEIRGQINANGQVVLVNPNGIFFGSTASVNVGGLIASGLDISPADFMNGDYIFNEVSGTDGTVINSGLINASLGGNVVLLGKQVVNEGVISAKLGSVTLAAGKAAVLTFDNQGLLGIKITKEVLQDELGIDPAVLNSGEISAEGGRILLTASVSQDVFSQAVNTGDIKQATSVVMHEDGSFTLGGGADVINTGLLDVSTTENNQDAGQIVVLGENVTSSGIIKADAQNANGGDIELHANNTALLTEDSQTSARSENFGTGGVVKVLGHHVGLFDQASVDVSGANGGGQALIGGDYQGKNTSIRNAKRTFVAKNSRILADTIDEGDGGKVIVWANESTQFYGDIFARGGAFGGNGGFAEVSGKEGLIFSGFADLTARFGEKGTLLLDPKNITINTDPTSDNFNIPGINDYDGFGDISGTETILNNEKLAIQLNSSDVRLRANTDINVNADVIVTSGSNNLILDAGRSINIADSFTITLNGGNFNATVNHNSASNSNRVAGDAVFNMGTGSSIATNGGDINISTGTFDSSNQIGDFTLQTLNSTGLEDVKAGAITVTNSKGNIDVNNQLLANGGTASNGSAGQAGGAITLTASEGNVTINALISSDGSNGGRSTIGKDGGDAGVINIEVGNQYTQNAAISAVGGAKSGTFGVVGVNGNITIKGDKTSNIFTFNAGTSLTGGTIAVNGLDGSDTFKIFATVAARIDGGNGTDTLTANNVENTWEITSVNGGIVTGINEFSNIENLVGNADIDKFFIKGGSIGSIDGAGGADTLTADDIANTWEITSANGGTVTGTNEFSNIENLVGNRRTDDFSLNGGTISGTIDGAGGAGMDTLTADTGSNNWLITEANGGSVTGTGGFLNIENLNGNTGNDDFVLAGGTLSGAIDGGGGTGTNTLQADNRPNSWGISGDDAGAVTGVGAGFSKINNLTGGSGDDTFTFTSAGSISGLIDGGGDALDQDIVDVRSLTDVTVQIGDAPNGDINVIDIEQIIANTTGTNTLIAGNAVNDWEIKGPNSGSLNDIVFTNFNRLVGNEKADTFILHDGFSVDNGIDALDGFDILDGKLLTGARVFDLGSTTGAFDNFERVIGNNIDSTLNADTTTANNWQITGSNSGTVGDIEFLGFNNLTGGDFVDTFNVNGGAITGIASGGAGDDAVIVTLLDTEGVFDFDGGAGEDTVTLTGDATGYTGVYSETLPKASFAYTNTSSRNKYTVTYQDVKTVRDELQADSLTVNGTVNDDTISLADNTFTLANGAVSYANKDKLVIAGLGGDDVVNIAAAINIPNTVLEIRAESLTNDSSSLITADTLFLNGVNTAGSTGPRIHTDVDYLRLANVTGEVFITEANAVDISELTTTGAFDLQSAGSVTASADMVSDNDFKITASSIILSNNNKLTGELSLLAAGGNVTLNNSDTLLAAVDAQTLNIISNSIANTAASQINVTGSTTLEANGQDIILNGDGHRFTDLTVSNTANLTLFDSESSALTISNVDVTGNADISASGDLNTNTVSAGGTVSLTTGGSVIDGNANVNNVTASLLEIVAVSGIGAGNALETQVSTMDIVNTGSGAVELQQIGVVDLVALKNTGTLGDITFTSDTDIRFNPGSVVANRSAGDLLMTTSSGSFLGLGTADINNPDITAQNATFLGLLGTFGTLQRHLVLDVPGAVLIDTQASFNPEFVPPGPASVDTRGIDFSVLGAISAVAGEQLVEVETLGEIDPAIFTDLHNYSLQETSIRLPRDQLFEDELEEYDRL